MKKILAILILILTFQTPSQADDIRDFQIEGMSIGDSLLDFYSEKEIKKNYCFYWYNYLTAQLEYISFWQKRLKDLEMLLIVFQVVIQTIKIKESKNSSPDISATSISEITGIPRATCIRKLDKFVKMKVLEKNLQSKRYSLFVSKNNHNEFINPQSMSDKVSLFSDFSSTIINALQK